ncbi:MAG: hypothetical protein KGL04_04245 [Elusimicrobia bacterium]|nr:hypothetical protein [Elusimicrobiota bacterium]MDE2313368.1 hypothetical protein [Elusimicrobiota bacterium]
MDLSERLRAIPAWPFLSAASLAILASAPAQYLGRQQDDLIYFIAARALTLGHYYLLTSPLRIPLTMANPGLPAILAPLILLFGANPGVCQCFCALLLATTPWVLWLWLRRRHGHWIALFISLLFGLSPIVLSQAGTLMSEAPFFLFTLLLLLSLENKESGARSGFLLFAVTQIRSSGLAFLPGAASRSWQEGNWRKSLWITVPALAGFVLWSLWSWHAAGALQKTQELALSYAGRFWSLLPSVVWGNARYYLSAWGSSYMPQGWAPAGGPALGCVLAVLALRGAVVILHRRPTDPAVWMLAGFMALHLIWPWHYDRYLLVPLPFLLDCAASALKRRWIAPVLLALLAGQTAFQSPRWMEGTSWSKVEMAQTYSWLRAHSHRQDVLSSAFYVRDGYYARRPSLPLPGPASPQELANDMKKYRIRFILWQSGLDLGLSLGKSAAVRGMLEGLSRDLNDKRLFRAIYKNPAEHSRIYVLKA